jgi:hypothetical protein
MTSIGQKVGWAPEPTWTWCKKKNHSSYGESNLGHLAHTYFPDLAIIYYNNILKN